MTHDELVERAEKWLRGTLRCSVVVTESKAHFEEPDAIGWRGGRSYLVECKTSRSDYARDAKKRHRRDPETGLGSFRYYFTTPGLLTPDELRDGWGLVECHERVCRKVRDASEFVQRCEWGEMLILLWRIRRLEELVEPSELVETLREYLRSARRAADARQRDVIRLREEIRELDSSRWQTIEELRAENLALRLRLAERGAAE